MAANETEVAIVGAGAAGIGAARRLQAAGVACLLIEARSRLGGRAWTVADRLSSAIDLGCGWLHSADRNPWREIAEAQGRTIDQTPPPWARPSLVAGFPLAEQAAFQSALGEYRGRLAAHPDSDPDLPAAAFLDQHGRWNELIDAVSTYYSGAELDRVSAQDLNRYDDNGVNWRIVEGYGTTISAHGADLPVVLGSPVRRIDHGGRRVRLEMADGAITADAVIVTVPSSLIAEQRLLFDPELPEKTEAALGLPLGLADKLFLLLSHAEDFAPDTRLFGRTDRRGTGAYHVRPFGRPQIEAYFGGSLAAELEKDGEAAFVDFAIAELTNVLGAAFAARVKPLALHCWGSDPFARGSYSYALPGRAGCRATLAAPVDDRLFFAGEACSRNDFSTAHGAYLSGVAAAEQAIAARAG